MSRCRTWGVALGAVTVVGSACREATPPDTAARYRLRSVDGTALPAVVFQGNGVTGWVTAGEATLGPGGAFLLVVRDSSDSPVLPEPAETDSLAGRYRLGGARLVVDFAPPESGAAYADTGEVSAAADTLRIRTHYPVGVSGGLPTRLFLYTRR